MSSTVHATFLVAAPDQPGLVARLAGFFYGAGLNIIDAGNHTDVHAEGGARFFMRMVVDVSGLSAPAASAALGGSSTRAAGRWAAGSSCRTRSPSRGSRTASSSRSGSTRRAARPR